MRLASAQESLQACCWSPQCYCPFAAHLGDLDLSAREETPEANLGITTLITTVAPEALGISSNGPEATYFGPANQVETISFVGVTTGLAAIVALCLPAPRRMVRGARAAMAGATLLLGLATFAGGWPLRVLQLFPVFSDNFIGRTRSILGFTVAVLAALGLEALLERRTPNGRRGWIVAGAVSRRSLRHGGPGGKPRLRPGTEPRGASPCCGRGYCSLW